MKDNHQTCQCSHLLGNLSEYIDGALQAEICASLEEHLQGCENCRIVVNTLQKTVELCTKTSTEKIDLPPDVRERLFSRLDLTDFSK
jgi:RNA polymerase sigma-70 factor (ECF subfamily)